MADKKKPIGKNEIANAQTTLDKYKAGNANLEKRIISNEQWWKMRHWGEFASDKADANRPKPASAWLFNSIANKHADAMDNYPEPTVLPREQNDEGVADTLSAVLPVLLEYNDYESTYNEAWWKKLRSGTSCQAVVWNNAKENGLGNIDIKNVDLLNLFWEPGIKDIQQSANVFYVYLEDRDRVVEQYPETDKKALSESITTSKYRYDDNVDTTDKVQIIDWYYKRKSGTRTILHYAKFCGGELLYSSENDAELRDVGFYDHGEYPFVLDTLFSVEGTPCGFGYVDVMKDAQMYIDKLGQVVLEHTVHMTRKRFFVKNGSVLNEAEFADWTKPFVHTNGRVDDGELKEIKIDPLDNSVLTVLNNKIEELKETSGNRDFSQGGTTSGVTAASAIAALQEAGNKLSRDMIKSSYNAYRKVCHLVIELIRQFYTEERTFRIVGEGGRARYISLDNRQLMPRDTIMPFSDGETATRMAIFDVSVKAARKSPFSKAAQNELAKELYGAGFFNPQLAEQALATLSIMDFEGKDEVIEKISKNAQMYQMLQQLQIENAQLKAMMGGMQPAVANPSMPMPNATSSSKPIGNVADAVNGAVRNASMDRARQRAIETTNPT